MSTLRFNSWRQIALIGLLVGTGGLLGILAGGMVPTVPSAPVDALKSASPSQAKTTAKARTPHPSVQKRTHDWLTRCRDASNNGSADWTAALASAPGWMRGRSLAYREEVERFVSATKEEGIKQAMQAGVSGELLSMAIGKQAPAMIPSLMAELLATPSLVSPGDLGQMIFDATKAGSNSAEALTSLAGHLRDFHSTDQHTLDSFGTIVGRLNLNNVKVLTDQIADEASRESILASAVKARAGSMEAGPELTEVIENFVVGVPALQAAFKNAGMAKGNASSSPQNVGTVLSWTRSLAGYKQTAALQGWIEAVREENPATEPIARCLADPDSTKDAVFLSKVIELSSPAITQQGQTATRQLAALLEAHPHRQALLDAQPDLKALLTTSP